MLGRFSHAVICVRDLDVSVEFYKKLGLNAFFEFTHDDPIVGSLIGVEMRKVRMAFMRLGDDPMTPFLDIVQFVDPPTQGSPYPTLNNVGIPRIAFSVENIEETYEELQKIGVEFVTPLRRLNEDLAMVCFKDPDGIFLEIITPLRHERR